MNQREWEKEHKKQSRTPFGGGRGRCVLGDFSRALKVVSLCLFMFLFSDYVTESKSHHYLRI